MTFLTPGERAIIVVGKLRALEEARFALEVEAVANGQPPDGEAATKVAEAEERILGAYESLLRETKYLPESG